MANNSDILKEFGGNVELTHLEYWPNSFVLRIPTKLPFQLQRFRQVAGNSNVCDEFNRKLLTNSIDLHWQNTDTWLNTDNWENTDSCLNMIFQPPFLLASPYKKTHRGFWWNYISLSWKSKRGKEMPKKQHLLVIMDAFKGQNNDFPKKFCS